MIQKIFYNGGAEQKLAMSKRFKIRALNETKKLQFQSLKKYDCGSQPPERKSTNVNVAVG